MQSLPPRQMGESGEIILSEAGYDYDISDVPPELLEVFRLSGVCLGELDEALRLSVYLMLDKKELPQKVTLKAVKLIGAF